MDKETLDAIGIGEKETEILKFKNKENANLNNNSNVVARKFTLVVNIIKILGYISAIGIGIYVYDIEGEEFFPGLIAGVVTAASVWISTLLFEAIAEALNLLQDIKDKLK